MYAFICSLSVALSLLPGFLFAETAEARIAPIDETKLVTLRGNTHPLARPEFDRGPAPANLPLDRMLLVLKRSAAQETALQQLLDDQQRPSSPRYHKWLTPQQFGAQFGPSDARYPSCNLVAAIARIPSYGSHPRTHGHRVFRKRHPGRRRIPHPNPQICGER